MEGMAEEPFAAGLELVIEGALGGDAAERLRRCPHTLCSLRAGQYTYFLP